MTYRVSDGAGSSATATLRVGIIGFPRVRFYLCRRGAPNSADRRLRILELFRECGARDADRRRARRSSASRRPKTAGTSSTSRASRDFRCATASGCATSSNPTVPVVEISTGDPAFFTNTLSLSPDGTLVAFNERIASTATPALNQPVDAAGISIQRLTFTQNSRQVYYAVSLAGGGRSHQTRGRHRRGFGLGNQSQITANYRSRKVSASGTR